MKYLLITIFSLLLLTSSKIDDDFCDGWEEGYCEGWKDVKGQLSLCPITPICPIADIGCTTYKCGYNKGFKAGRKKADGK